MSGKLLFFIMSATFVLQAKIPELKEQSLVADKETFHAMVRRLERKRIYLLEKYFSAIMAKDLLTVRKSIRKDSSLINALPLDIGELLGIGRDSRPLFIACMQGNVGLVHYLIRKNVDIHVLDGDGHSAFSYLLSGDSISNSDKRSIFEALYKQGLTIDSKGVEGKSLFVNMMNSLCWSDDELFDFVGDVNVSINMQDDTGLTALDYALLHGYEKTAIALLKKIKPTLTGSNGKNMLSNMYLMPLLSVDILNACKEAGWDINAADAMGRTPIFYAVEAGDLFAVDNYRRIMQANLNHQDLQGKTALHVFIETLDARFAETTCRKKIYHPDERIINTFGYFANINLQDNDGNTPFHLLFGLKSISHDCLAILSDLFIKAHARIDIANNQGKTVRQFLKEHNISI